MTSGQETEWVNSYNPGAHTVRDDGDGGHVNWKRCKDPIKSSSLIYQHSEALQDGHNSTIPDHTPSEQLLSLQLGDKNVT